MAETGVTANAKGFGMLEGVKTTAGVVAAIVGTVTGLWTVYDKVKSEARQYTAASYETLAPQVNQMSEALRQMQQENQELRQALTAHAVDPRPGAARPTARPARPAATPHGQTAAAAPPPPAGTPAAAATPPAPAEAPDNALGQIVGSIHQAKQAVDAIRHVPDSFDKVLQLRAK